MAMTPVPNKDAKANDGAGTGKVPALRIASASANYGDAIQNRASQAAGQTLFGKGGLGYLARRGVEFGTSVALQTVEGVMRLATQQPLELLTLLPELIPEVGLAVWNGTFLSCGPDAVRLKAMTVGASGKSEEAPDGTAAIDALWDNQPDEAGGLIDCLGQNYQMCMFSGMCAAEAVPAGRYAGLSAVFPVNSLTLRFRREDDGKLGLYQRQTANPNGLGIYTAGFGGMFIPMPMDRFFYSRLPGLPDEPYGRAPFAPALTVVIETMAFWRDTMLAYHRIGAPKWDVGFDFEMWAKIATEIVGLTDPLEIDKWVQDKFDEGVAFFNNLKVDDCFFHDIKSQVKATGAGDKWPDITGLWTMLRLRLVQALKQLPTLMGIVEGSTETWSQVEWDIYTNAQKTIVHKAVEPLRKSSELHLQLLGMPYTVEAEYAPIKSVTRLIDAQAEGQEISNEARKRDEGWQLNDTAAMAITKSAAVAEPRSWQQAETVGVSIMEGE